MHLRTRAKEIFGVRTASPVSTDELIDRCARVYQGKPDWLDSEHGIRTVNFAQTICAETARLTMLGTKLTVGGGSQRAEWLQEQVDGMWPRLREWTEKGCAMGTVILRPCGDGVECLEPDQFAVTDVTGDRITGAVFISREYEEPERYFTRLEYHRFQPDGTYAISNRCFVGHSERDDGKPVPIEATPWAGLDEETVIENVDGPLFAVLRTPGANNRSRDGVMGVPVFAGALEELRDLDVAYSRIATEIYDSRRIVLIDDRLLMQAGTKVGAASKVELPDHVRKVSGIGAEEYYQEIDPKLNTTERLVGFNAILSQVGFKCGFSAGYFVFDEKTGMVTATQVESDDRRTVQLIKDVRDKLETAMDGLLYALDKWADLYDLAPAGAWEAAYDFGDITYSREEDRARWWGYVTQGSVPAWQFFVKFEGMSEEEARAMTDEAAAASQSSELPGLFGDSVR